MDLKEKLIISVAAGVPIKFIESIAIETAVIRVMPNITLSIGYSPSCYSIGKHVTRKMRRISKNIWKSWLSYN